MNNLLIGITAILLSVLAGTVGHQHRVDQKQFKDLVEIAEQSAKIDKRQNDIIERLIKHIEVKKKKGERL